MPDPRFLVFLVTGIVAMMLVNRYAATQKQATLIFAAWVPVVFAGMILTNDWMESRAFAAADAELSADPMYQLLKQHDPATYEEAKKALGGAIHREEPRGQAHGALRVVSGNALRKYLPVSSDEALNRYMGAVMSEVRELNSFQPHIAYAFLFRPGEGYDFEKYLSAESIRADQAACAEVIRTGLEAGERHRDDDRARSLIQEIITQLKPQFGDDVQLVEKPGVQGVNKARTCAVLLAFYDRVLALPPADAAIILRLMFSRG